MQAPADPRSAAVRLLWQIRAAGYTVEEFIALLRVDPFFDTAPLAPVQDFWTIPPSHSECADRLPNRG
ncbi:hypothetical protein ABIA39_005619 [Nocardia sp. GAS34]|jgi:hypothetical protein